MTTLYLVPKAGDNKRREYVNISPGGVEDGKFCFYNQYDQLHDCNQTSVQYFKTDTKAEAIEAAKLFKGTGRYIAVVQVKSTYYVWLDEVDATICFKPKVVRIINGQPTKV